MAGVALWAVQMLLERKRIETNLRYCHPGEAHLREAVERLRMKLTDSKTSTGATGAPKPLALATAEVFWNVWCPREDSNLHTLAGTRP